MAGGEKQPEQLPTVQLAESLLDCRGCLPVLSAPDVRFRRIFSHTVSWFTVSEAQTSLPSVGLKKLLACLLVTLTGVIVVLGKGC